jgi:hypothetical protein
VSPPLAVFLPDGATPYVMRVEEAKPRIARDGRVYTRRTVQPSRQGMARWYIYTEHPVDGPTIERAAKLLRDFAAQGG